MKGFGFKHTLSVFLAGCAFCRIRVWVTHWATQKPGTEGGWCSKQEHHICHGKCVTFRWTTKGFHVDFRVGGQCSHPLWGINTIFWIEALAWGVCSAQCCWYWEFPCQISLEYLQELCPSLRNHWCSKHLSGQTEAVLRKARGGTCANHVWQG